MNELAITKSHAFKIVLLVIPGIISILGVLFLRWSIFDIFFGFWLETLVMGVFGLFTILTRSTIGDRIIGIFLLIHFSGFLLGFFGLIYGFFAETAYIVNSTTVHIPNIFGVISKTFLLFKWTFLSLVGSYAISYYFNFFQKKEVVTLSKDLVKDSYKRIFVLYFPIIIAGKIIVGLGSATIPLILLIFGKTILQVLNYIDFKK
jgi:hypothetical protein